MSIEGPQRIIHSSKVGTPYVSYRKPTTNRSCGVFLLRIKKLQENITPTLNHNFLESIQDLKLQGKQMNQILKSDKQYPKVWGSMSRFSFESTG